VIADVRISVDAAAFDASIPGAMEEWLAEVYVALDQVADKVVETAKSLVPKRTSKLASTIVRGPLVVDPRGAYVQITAGDGTRYAIYQELGTFKMKATPYMRPAFAIAAGSLRGAGYAARSASTTSSRAAVRRAAHRQRLRQAVRAGALTSAQARREAARIARIRNFGARGARR
jgi:HK97 gp10 family phage protein